MNYIIKNKQKNCNRTHRFLSNCQPFTSTSSMNSTQKTWDCLHRRVNTRWRVWREGALAKQYSKPGNVEPSSRKHWQPSALSLVIDSLGKAQPQLRSSPRAKVKRKLSSRMSLLRIIKHRMILYIVIATKNESQDNAERLGELIPTRLPDSPKIFPK